MNEEIDESLKKVHDYILTLELPIEQMNKLSDMIADYGLDKYKQGLYAGGDITINELKHMGLKV